MSSKPRIYLLFFVTMLALGALACGTSAGDDSGAAPAPTVDTATIVADAVATVTAQQSLVNLDLPNATTLVDTELEATLVNIYRQVNPSVVFIVGRGSTGTGFVFDADGHIVTNNHVLANETEFEIVFFNSERRAATVVGTDVDSDLAVIKVDSLPDTVVPVKLGNSRDVVVGEFVVAIGNPFAEQSSMSFGIVSGLGRSLNSMRGIEGRGFYSLPEVIQTDAPINPGNSGGPLLNLAGEVIGVNSAIRTDTGFNSGVGFSIPVNAVRLIAPVLISDGAYVYPYLGVQITSLDLALQNRLGLDDTLGALVTAANEGQPAAEGGIIAGDVIRTINGDIITDSDALIAYLVFETTVGETVDMEVIRDGEILTFAVTLGERP